MTNLHDKSTSLDIAAHARRAEHLTPEDMPMRMETHDYSTGAWQRPPRKKRDRTPGLVLIFAGLIAVLFTLMIAHLVVRSGVAGWL